MWIKRTLEARFRGSPGGVLPVWLLVGPRQVGKSSLLERCSDGSRQYVNLDELQVRSRAKEAPELFAKELTLPLIIDEIQFAPQLLSAIKILADSTTTPGAIWLTGSQSFEVMKGVRETLAGRVALIELGGLTDEEKLISDLSPKGYFDSIIETGFPRIRDTVSAAERAEFLDSYTRTYIERDVRELLGIQKRREFDIFLKICALRTGQVVNFDSMASDVGVSPKTIKEWLSLLEDCFLIRLVPPFFTNRSKRLIKNQKLYFLDMGLAAFLAGWTDGDALRLGPIGGAAFETHVFSNLMRYFSNRCEPASISFWRTRDGDEIDFLVEARGRVTPIEVKMGVPAPRSLKSLEAIRDSQWTEGHVISLSASHSVPTWLTNSWKISAPWSLDAIFA